MTGLLNIFLVITLIARLSVAGPGISFDFEFYIHFIDDVRREPIDQFLEHVSEAFPYYAWGFARYEFGFATLVYVFPVWLTATTVYTTVAASSLFVKLEVLRRMRAPWPVLILAYVFFVTLFEVNAIRAGVALACLMIAVLLLSSGKPIKCLLWMFGACAFHISAIAILVLVLASLAVIRMRLGNLSKLTLLLIGLLVPPNLSHIASVAGGKLEEYARFAERFDVYTGASGLNVTSAMCALFAMFFASHLILQRGERREGSQHVEHATGFVLSYFVGLLILFSGLLAIIGDRIWQLALPVLLAFMCRQRGVDPLQSWANLISQNLLAQRGLLRVIAAGARSGIYVCMTIYIIGNLLIRYPHTNFFNFILDDVVLVPPELE